MGKKETLEAKYREAAANCEEARTQFEKAKATAKAAWKDAHDKSAAAEEAARL